MINIYILNKRELIEVLQIHNAMSSLSVKNRIFIFIILTRVPEKLQKLWDMIKKSLCSWGLHRIPSVIFVKLTLFCPYFLFLFWTVKVKCHWIFCQKVLCFCVFHISIWIGESKIPSLCCWRPKPSVGAKSWATLLAIPSSCVEYRNVFVLLFENIIPVVKLIVAGPLMADPPCCNSTTATNTHILSDTGKIVSTSSCIDQPPLNNNTSWETPCQLHQFSCIDKPPLTPQLFRDTVPTSSIWLYRKI